MKGESMSVDQISEELEQIDRKINHAVQSTEGDLKASPILRAVVKELHEKSMKALKALDNGDEESIHEHVIELEEAADCAKVAAQTDINISNSTREIVLEAHEALCEFKSHLLQS